MRFRGIGLFVFGMAFSTAHADSYTGARADFSLHQLEKIFESQSPPETIEETLDRIEDESPRIYENFVLMYRSKSLQASSFMNPRAIIYNTDASFLLSFNGHESQRGFDRLEMIQFKYIEKKWELRELAKENGVLKLSAPNPRVCLQCHQSPDRVEPDPRPNWEPYSRWPGAYGSEGTHFNIYVGAGIYRKEDDLHIADAMIEREKLTAFLTEVQPGHPRYRHLKVPDIDDVMNKPTNLTDMLAKLNFQRIMRLAQSDAPEHFAKIRNLFAGAMKCGKFYADEPDLSAWEKKTPDSREEFVTEPANLMRARIREPQEVYSLDGEAPIKVVIQPEKYPNISVSEALFLLFEPFGIDISDWSMDFRTNGRLAFRERFGTPSNPQAQTAQAFREVFPEDGKRNCDELIPQAVVEAANLKHLPAKPEVPRKPLISRCISCHADGEFGIPQIPFDRPDLLKSTLGKKISNGRTLLEEIRYRTSDHATDEERMPRGSKPSLRERAALIKYLEDL